jgi:acyl carrier protein
MDGDGDVSLPASFRQFAAARGAAYANFASNLRETVAVRTPGVSIDENTLLVSSGLIDSMALVDLLVRLEDLTHMRIPAGKVQPKDLDTVAKMFATAQRVGKPTK